MVRAETARAAKRARRDALTAAVAGVAVAGVALAMTARAIGSTRRASPSLKRPAIHQPQRHKTPSRSSSDPIVARATVIATNAVSARKPASHVLGPSARNALSVQNGPSGPSAVSRADGVPSAATTPSLASRLIGATCGLTAKTWAKIRAETTDVVKAVANADLTGHHARIT